MGGFQAVEVNASNVVTVVQMIVTVGSAWIIWKFNDIKKEAIKDKEKAETELKDLKKELESELRDQGKRIFNQNADQYNKIHENTKRICENEVNVAKQESLLYKELYEMKKNEKDK